MGRGTHTPAVGKIMHLSADMTPLAPQACDGGHVGAREALEFVPEQDVVLNPHLRTADSPKRDSHALLRGEVCGDNS